MMRVGASLSPGRQGRLARALATAALIAVPLAVPSPARAQFFWSGPRYSADDAARIAIQHGFRVLQRPTRSDDVYVAEIVDRRGNRGRLIVSGETGAVVQRFFYARSRPDIDSDIPPGPVPPGRIPNEERRPGFFARLFGDDGGERQDRSTRLDRPPVQEDEARPRARPQRSRNAEQAPLDTVRPAPVESRPLAPPSAAPTLPPRVATPRPTVPAPVQASLPPASAPVSSAPAAPAGRAISTNPLAIPGSRTQDEKNTKPSEAKVEPAKPVEPLKSKPATVPVAPLE